jgi:hypothetical protein
MASVNRVLGRNLTRRMRGPLLGGIWLRVVARRRAADLDRRLASGADPMLSDELALRVGQLGSAVSRTRLAHALSEAVDRARGRSAPLVRTTLRRAEVRENDELLLRLAVRLRDGEPLGVQGLAMTARLVDDRSSPLYRSAGGSLSAAASEALAGLHHGLRTVSIPQHGRHAQPHL